MSSSGAKSLITDNLVINNVFAVQDDGTPQKSGHVLVTEPSGKMSYRPYDGTEVWYNVPAGNTVDLSGNIIIKCPNMVSNITSTGGINNCINISSPTLDGDGNRLFNITTNISTLPSSGIQINSNGSNGIEITNTDKGSNWSNNPALTSVNFSGNGLNNTGTISGSGGTVDLSGSININGPISNSSGLVQINDTLDLTGNNIQGVNGLTASGTITAGTVTAGTLNYTGNLQNNGTNITNIVQTITSGNGSGITVTNGTTTNPNISTNLKAGSNITFIPSTTDTSITIDVSGGGASQWVTTGNNIAYTNGTIGGNIGINNNYPLAGVDIEGSYSNSGGQYYINNATITIPTDATIMYFEIIGAGSSLDGSGNGGYATGYFDVSPYFGEKYNIYVNNDTFTTIGGTEGNNQYVIAYNGSENGANNGTINSNNATLYPSSCNGPQLPSYILPGYGRPGQPGLVYISFKQPSIRAIGDIISGGTITGGPLVGTSLNVSDGSISGGSITGTSLDVSGGTITSNNIFTSTSLLYNNLYTNNISNITLLSLIKTNYSNYPFTTSSNYIRISILAIGGGAGGGYGISGESGGGGGGSGQELSGIYYVPVTSTLSITIGSGGSGGSSYNTDTSGGITTVVINPGNITLLAYGAPSVPSSSGSTISPSTGGDGWFGGGGGAGSVPGNGGNSFVSNGFKRTGKNGSNGAGAGGGDGDSPSGTNGGGAGGDGTGNGGGGGGGASSSLGQGGNANSPGTNGSGGGGGNGANANGGKGGDGCVQIQIFSV